MKRLKFLNNSLRMFIKSITISINAVWKEKVNIVRIINDLIKVSSNLKKITIKIIAIS